MHDLGTQYMSLDSLFCPEVSVFAYSMMIRKIKDTKTEEKNRKGERLYFNRSMLRLGLEIRVRRLP